MKGENKMLNKNEWYFENASTGEITNDSWLADFWAEIDKVDVIFWKWSDVCDCWLARMVRKA